MFHATLIGCWGGIFLIIKVMPNNMCFSHVFLILQILNFNVAYIVFGCCNEMYDVNSRYLLRCIVAVRF
jgi:hypothetical protein